MKSLEWIDKWRISESESFSCRWIETLTEKKFRFISWKIQEKKKGRKKNVFLIWIFFTVCCFIGATCGFCSKSEKKKRRRRARGRGMLLLCVKQSTNNTWDFFFFFFFFFFVLSPIGHLTASMASSYPAPEDATKNTAVVRSCGWNAPAAVVVSQSFIGQWQRQS